MSGKKTGNGLNRIWKKIINPGAAKKLAFADGEEIKRNRFQKWPLEALKIDFYQAYLYGRKN